MKKQVDSMPIIRNYGNFISFLRWIRMKYEKYPDISEGVDAILEPIIRIFTQESESIPLDTVYTVSNQLNTSNSQIPNQKMHQKP